MTDEQLFWAGIGIGAAGFGLALGILIFPHLAWHLNQFIQRRRHGRRMGLIRSYLP